jgi:hypothetical protein
MMVDTMFASGSDAHLSTFNPGNGARHGDFTDQHRTARVKRAKGVLYQSNPTKETTRENDGTPLAPRRTWNGCSIDQLHRFNETPEACRIFPDSSADERVCLRQAYDAVKLIGGRHSEMLRQCEDAKIG